MGAISAHLNAFVDSSGLWWKAPAEGRNPAVPAKRGTRLPRLPWSGALWRRRSAMEGGAGGFRLRRGMQRAGWKLAVVEVGGGDTAERQRSEMERGERWRRGLSR